MDIGTITEIAKDGEALICTVSFGVNDVITATLFGLSSQNEYPMIDDQVAVQRGNEENVIVALYRGAPSDLLTGESITYGRDATGAIVSSVKCCSDGQIKINGGGRSISAFDKLKDGFDALVSDFNEHAHKGSVDSTSGACTILPPLTSVPPSPSTASVDGSESSTVEVP